MLENDIENRHKAGCWSQGNKKPENRKGHDRTAISQPPTGSNQHEQKYSGQNNRRIQRSCGWANVVRQVQPHREKCNFDVTHEDAQLREEIIMRRKVSWSRASDGVAEAYKNICCGGDTA